MRLEAAEIVEVTGGYSLGDPFAAEGVATDSRQISGGELFIPLRELRDGHDFIDAALRAGAAGYLTEHPCESGAGVVVRDAPEALRNLARMGRQRVQGPVIGITGSVGKTTTKDLTAAVLAQRFHTYANSRSFNNHIGVPVTILGAPDDVEILVVEIGTNGPGEIQQLSALAQPTIGVVTRVAAAHTKGLGDVEGVAYEKGQLIRALPESGHAVLNADDDRVLAMRDLTRADVITVGESADVAISILDVDDDLRPLVRLRTPWGVVQVRLASRGAHQATNAAAAVAVAGLVGVPLEAMEHGLAEAPLSRSRMELRRNPNGAAILDDSYNANPASVVAALRALKALPARRHVAVLGIMAELGDSSAEEHRQIGLCAEQLGVKVIAVSAPDYGARTVNSIEEAVAELGPLSDNDAVLIKGSRVAALDQMVALLLESVSPPASQ